MLNGLLKQDYFLVCSHLLAVVAQTVAEQKCLLRRLVLGTKRPGNPTLERTSLPG